MAYCFSKNEIIMVDLWKNFNFKGDLIEKYGAKDMLIELIHLTIDIHLYCILWFVFILHQCCFLFLFQFFCIFIKFSVVHEMSFSLLRSVGFKYFSKNMVHSSIYIYRRKEQKTQIFVRGFEWRLFINSIKQNESSDCIAGKEPLDGFQQNIVFVLHSKCRGSHKKRRILFICILY